MISARDGGRLQCLVVGSDGDLVGLDAAPTVQLRDTTGAVIASPPTATVDPLGPGRYSAPLPAGHPALDDLGALTVTWTGTINTDPWSVTDPVEVIGGWPFTLSEMRAANTDLADPDRRPAHVLAAARQVAVERVGSITRVAWVSRRRTDTLIASGTLPTLLLPHPQVQTVHSITVNDTTLDVSQVTIHDTGALDYPFPTGAVVTVDYTHGHPTCPSDVAGAIRDLAVFTAASWGARMPDRATTISTDVGTFRLSMPGRDGPTGLPEVDAILAPYRRPAIG